MKHQVTSHLRIAPLKELWTGRASSSKDQYWHEQIKLIEELKELNALDVALIGYACDSGVKRNQGRIGAANAPNVIKQQLAKLPWHAKETRVADLGSITDKNADMEQAQEQLAKMVSLMLQNNSLPISIGGGHDIAYASYCGIRDALDKTSPKRLGVINFDAHFDLRPIVDRPNSGTPFLQILNDENNHVHTNYLAIGIQQQSNTRELFEIAKAHQVSFVKSEECLVNKRNFDQIVTQLQQFIAQSDHVNISIDMDGFSSAYAPGVSAPSPLGFSPDFFFAVLGKIIRSTKMIAVDIAETNPSYDIDNCTSKLAARIIDFIVTNQ